MNAQMMKISRIAQVLASLIHTFKRRLTQIKILRVPLRDAYTGNSNNEYKQFRKIRVAVGKLEIRR